MYFSLASSAIFLPDMFIFSCGESKDLGPFRKENFKDSDTRSKKILMRNIIESRQLQKLWREMKIGEHRIQIHNKCL